MTEQQEHLKNLLRQFKELSNEMAQLQNQAAVKRELLLKVQGAIEYLQQTGVLPPEEEVQEEVQEETAEESE